MNENIKSFEVTHRCNLSDNFVEIRKDSILP